MAKLVAIDVGHGVAPALAREVAEQLMAKDALGTPCAMNWATRRPLRVTFWGALAMALTAGIGTLVGTAV